MPENYRQTVNLKEKMNSSRLNQPKPEAFSRNVQAKPANINGEQEKKQEQKNEFHTIDRPREPKFRPGSRGKIIRPLLIIAGVILVFFLIRWVMQKKPVAQPADNSKTVQENNIERWYSVKLVNGEVFYGKIGNNSADPVVIKNVYYNYDQVKGATTTDDGSGNLRLVKRGKETYGPDGSLDVVRSQILYMEPMKEDSKVLQAILEYEK